MQEFFEWYRKEMGGRLTQKQVDDANALIDKVGIEEAKRTLAKHNWQMQLSNKGFKMLAVFEGFHAKPYLDGMGVSTIGYGNTYYLDSRKFKMTDKPISRDNAKKLKMAVIHKDFAPAVNHLLEKEIKAGRITQNMFDALTSLAYNIGVGALAKSSVIRHIKTGNMSGGGRFLLYNKAGGRVLAGLDRRRKAERAWFLA